MTAVAAQVATYQHQLVVATNKARIANGRWPLTVRAPLVKAAEAHTKVMAKTGWFQHTEADGTDLRTRLNRVHWRITYVGAGENIAFGYTPAGTVSAWLKSPGHRANLLNARFRWFGVGDVSGLYFGTRAMYVTADYAG